MAIGTDLQDPAASPYYNCHQQKHELGPPVRCGFDSRLLFTTAHDHGVTFPLGLSRNLQSWEAMVKLVGVVRYPVKDRQEEAVTCSQDVQGKVDCA